MSERKASPFPTLLNNDVCSLIQAEENVYQIRFKNRAANAYLVRGKSRTVMVDVGLTSNYPALRECLEHIDCPPEKIDMVILSHEHLDHIGAAWFFNEQRTIVAAHRLAANKIMLRDDFSMLRKMFNCGRLRCPRSRSPCRTSRYGRSRSHRPGRRFPAQAAHFARPPGS
jgi:hydroxyacylglutathione hydrolase